ncbi:MAG: ribbon-helix-helix domain-containing protein [Gemmatimonadaceae bacterium]|nr:ribbon-helix-helix domain-containing protein [Gemmatimonadaceae bacterium]
MPKAKIAVTIDQQLVADLDAAVARGDHANRSQAIESALRESAARHARTRLARECARLDATEESELSELGIAAELAEWPEY